MPVYEIKKNVAITEVDRIEELLAELEEQRLMVLEDKPSASACIAGYFNSREEALQAWERFDQIAGAEWSKGDPEVRELPDVDWKDSYKAHFKASKFGRLNWVPVWERETFVLPQGEAGSGLGNFTWPFFALLSQAKICLTELSQGNFDGRFSFGLVAMLGLVTQAALLWLRREPESPWWRVGAAYALLLPFLGVWVWSGYWAACRALVPLTIVFNLLLPANRAFWPLWIVGNLTLLHAVWRFV